MGQPSHRRTLWSKSGYELVKRWCPVRMNLARARFTDLRQDNFTRTVRPQTVRMNLAFSVPTPLLLSAEFVVARSIALLSRPSRRCRIWSAYPA